MITKKTYVPKLSLRDTVDYCNKFKKIVYETIGKKYELININLPILSELNSGINVPFSKKRNINFDNYTNYNVYEMIQNYNNVFYYYIWNLELVENECLHTYYSLINRDANINKNTSMQQNFEVFGFVVQEEDRNNNTLFSFCKLFTSAFDKAINSLSDIYKTKSYFKNIKMYDIRTIKKMYPFLSHKESLERFITSNKIALVSNIMNEFDGVRIEQENFFDGYDWENTIGLYMFDENQSTIVNVIMCTISPNWNIYNKQKRFFGQNIVSNDFTNLLKSDKYPIIASVSINFDLIFYMLLDKFNIHELTSINNNYNISELYKNFKRKK